MSSAEPNKPVLHASTHAGGGSDPVLGLSDTRVATVIVAADGSGDFTDIQDGIDDLPVAGGMVFIKDGTYEIDTTITILGDNITLQGQGPATIIKAADAAWIFLITLGDASHTPDNIRIYDIKFDGNGTNEAGRTAIYTIEDVSNLEIDHCIFYDFTYVASFMWFADGGLTTNLTITNCTFTLGSGGINIDDVTGFKCNNNYFDAAANNIVYTVDIDNFWIQDNYIKATGAYYIGPTGALMLNNGNNGVISDNFFDVAGYHGMYFYRVDNCRIENNYFLSTVRIPFVLQECDQVVIQGNVINTNSNSYGIYLDTCTKVTAFGNILSTIQEHGIVLDTLTDSTISGNVFKDMGIATNNTYDDINIVADCVRNTITGNLSYTVNANKARYMINEAATSNNYNYYCNNYGSGHATSIYRLQGANSHLDWTQNDSTIRKGLTDWGAIYPRGHLWGLTMSNAADTANDITVAVGEACAEGGGANIVLASAITKRLDAAWAVGTNQGGLNTGAEANSTWYEVHLIKRVDTGVVDVMFTTTANRATLPANYTLQRRIGWIRNSGAGAILQFTQVDDHFTWTTQINDVATTKATAAAQVTLTVPPNSIARFRATVDMTTSVNANAVIVFSEIVEGDVTPAVTTGIGSLGYWDLNTGVSAGHFELRVNSSSQIEHDSSVQVGNFDISTFGFIDHRGKMSDI